MTPYHKSDGLTVWNGDALDAYREYADSAFGLLWLDPPYYKVLSRSECPWDHQWATSADYLDWLGQHADEWQRILAPNGSLYVCASPQMAWEVEGVLRQRFNVASRITWEKQNGWHKKQNKEEMRQYNDSVTETIFFCEHYGADNIAKGEAGWEAKCDELRGFVFEPLQEWFRERIKRGGLNHKAINGAIGSCISGGGMASHYFGDTGQYSLPTLSMYEKMQSAWPDLFDRDYEDLRRDYEDLRRPFFATPDRPFTSVWHYETVQAYNGKHPAEKPYPMVRDVVLTSSREDMLCGDFFAGSGVFGRACRDLGRSVVLCDQAEEWAYKATQRAMGPPLLRLIDAPAEAPTAQQGGLR